MEPLQLVVQTLEQLDEIVLKMSSPEWTLGLLLQPEEVRRESQRELLRAQQARVRLGNAQLAAIVSELRVNEDALLSGRQHVNEALKRLDKVEGVLTAVSGFVGVVSRVVTLV